VYDAEMQFQSSTKLAGLALPALALAVAAGAAQAVEWHGLLDVRAVDASASRSFL
jgi:hypothetical protein